MALFWHSPRLSRQAYASSPKATGDAFYYGWANLVIAALAMVATLPGRTQGLGLITEPLIADLRLDRVTYANINLWATLIIPPLKTEPSALESCWLA